MLGERRDEPRLPDPGLASDRDESQGILRLVLGHGLQDPPEDRPQLRGFIDAAHERRGGPARIDARARQGLHRPPGRLRIVTLGQRLVAHEMPRGSIGRVAHGDGVDRGRRLEPCGVGHHLARHALADPRTRGTQRHHRLARVDADPYLQAVGEALRVHTGDRVLDAQGREDGADGIVLVGDGRAEDPHDGIADELVDLAPVELDDLFQRGVERHQRGVHVLRVRAIRALSEPHEIAEQDRHELPLLAPDAGEGRSAVQAEARVLGVGLGAARADDHGSSVRKALRRQVAGDGHASRRLAGTTMEGTMSVLHETALALVAPGKGILAADESTGTIAKRFDAIGVGVHRGDIAARTVSCSSRRRRWATTYRRHPLRRDDPPGRRRRPHVRAGAPGRRGDPGHQGGYRRQTARALPG